MGSASAAMSLPEGRVHHGDPALRGLAAAEASIPVTVLLLGREHEQFERAMAAAKEELGRNARRGQCLERLCEVYLRDLDTATRGSPADGEVA